METRTDRPRASLKAEPDAKVRIFSVSPLASLEAESQRAVLELGRIEELPKHLSLAEQGEPARSLFLLGAGRVKLERSSGGRLFPLGHRGPGDMVGEGAVAGGTATESATVIDDVEALVFPIPGMRKLF